MIKVLKKEVKKYADRHLKITDDNALIKKVHPREHGLVEYYYGLTVKEKNGSQIFYFPDMDSHETTTDKLKEKIAAQMDRLDKESIEICDSKGEKTGDYQ